MKLDKGLWAIVAGLFVAAMATTAPRPAHAVALINGLGGPAGYGTGNLPPNDDGSSPAIDITGAFPMGLRFFGSSFNEVFVNNNGNMTFGGPLGQFTPQAFPVASRRMIAPWWGDVDTRSDGRPSRNGVYWDIRPGQFIVTWHNVGYFTMHDDQQNDFQMILRSFSGCADRSIGDFDVEFRYNRCEWVTGDASGGRMGHGGTPTQIGFDAGDSIHFYSIPGSLMDDFPMPLATTTGIRRVCRDSNISEPGVWRFRIRGGELPCMGGGTHCDTGRMGVCAGGTIQCRMGMPTCVQDVPASAESCNGLDNNCDGVIDTGPCPAGFVCDRATCVPRCVEGGCFEGQVCTDRGTCIDGACTTVTCPQGQRCAAGMCVDACQGLHCPNPSVCRLGRCVDACLGVTCETGQVCEDGRCVLNCRCRDCGANRVCLPSGNCAPADCRDISCTPPFYCQSAIGGEPGSTPRCSDPCSGATCPRGEICREGRCVAGSETDGGFVSDAAPPQDTGPGDASPVDDAGSGADTGVGGDAGMTDAVADTGPTLARSSGCGCTTTGSSSSRSSWVLGAAMLGVALARRRRRG